MKKSFILFIFIYLKHLLTNSKLELELKLLDLFSLKEFTSYYFFLKNFVSYCWLFYLCNSYMYKYIRKKKEI